MRGIFVDAAAWIAILNEDDYLHSLANALFDELNGQRVMLITTDFVLIEVADALCAPVFRAATVAFINQLRESQVKIIPVSFELLDKGWSLYTRRPDKNWGLTDCTSFVVMEELGITEAFTSDQHFTQAGFQRLMSAQAEIGEKNHDSDNRIKRRNAGKARARIGEASPGGI